MINGNKKKILDFLKKESEKTASEISGYLSINYYKTLRLLAQLEKENKIEIFKFRDKKYYRLMKSCFGTKQFGKKSGICQNCDFYKDCEKEKEKKCL